MIAEADECVNVLGDHALLITIRKDSANRFSLGSSDSLYHVGIAAALAIIASPYLRV
jgi:hypothetical protein